MKPRPPLPTNSSVAEPDSAFLPVGHTKASLQDHSRFTEVTLSPSFLLYFFPYMTQPHLTDLPYPVKNLNTVTIPEKLDFMKRK